MLAGLSVLAAQQCAEAEAEAAEPPENMLSYGLTHLWTSPILRYQLMKQGHASLQLLEAAVLDLVAVGTPVAACTASFRACTEWSSAMGSSWRCPVAVCATSTACAAPAALPAMPCDLPGARPLRGVPGQLHAQAAAAAGRDGERRLVRRAARRLPARGGQLAGGGAVLGLGLGLGSWLGRTAGWRRRCLLTS